MGSGLKMALPSTQILTFEVKLNSTDSVFNSDFSLCICNGDILHSGTLNVSAPPPFGVKKLTLLLGLRGKEPGPLITGRGAAGGRPASWPHPEVDWGSGT